MLLFLMALHTKQRRGMNKMKKTMSIGLSLILAAVMCVSLLPVAALAADAPPSSYTAHGYTVTVTQLGGQYGYVGPNGEFYSNRYASDGMVHISNQSTGKIGFCDYQGNIVIEPKYESGDIGLYFQRGLCRVKIFDEWTGIAKWGYIDKKGNLAIEAIYDEASDFINYLGGIAYVRIGNTQGYIDTSGEMVADFDARTGEIVTKAGVAYPDAYNDRSVISGYKVVTSNSKYGALDSAGNVVIPYRYDYLSEFNNGLASAKIGPGNSGAGIIDTKGNIVVPFDWSYIIDMLSDDGVVVAIWPGNSNQYVLQIGDDQSTITPPIEKPSAWAEEQVIAAINNNLVPQDLQEKYTQATTRAEFCALAVALYETVTGQEIEERQTFSDTTDINVEKMAALRVVNGMGDNKFDPNAGLTREQAATMLSRLAAVIGKPLTQAAAEFNDNADVSPWAIEAVGQMQATGIMGGVGNNTFEPKSPYTREQSIVTILRLYDVVK